MATSYCCIFAGFLENPKISRYPIMMASIATTVQIINGFTSGVNLNRQAVATRRIIVDKTRQIHKRTASIFCFFVVFICIYYTA